MNQSPEIVKGVRIHSNGTTIGTTVYVGDKILNGVTKIEILPMVPHAIVQARITVDVRALRMEINEAEINYRGNSPSFINEANKDIKNYRHHD